MLRQASATESDAPKFSFRDPTSYGALDRAVNRYGVLGNDTLWSPTLLRNRCHVNVAAAYAAVYGTSRLVACHDRVGIMRPAFSHPEWDTVYEYPGLHLDVDPLGFTTPGFDKQVDEFLSALTYADTRDFTSENDAKHFTMGVHVQVRSAHQSWF
jgi:hypothetical protein